MSHIESGLSVVDDIGKFLTPYLTLGMGALGWI